MKILIICLGNICRSPMGEALLKKHAKAKGLDWMIESAGTNRYHKGGPADPRSVAVCAKNGIDISGHVARRVIPDDFKKYDVLFSMASDVTYELRQFTSDPADLKKIVSFLEGADVPDPWYGGQDGFDACFEIIDQACLGWVNNPNIRPR